LLLAEISAFESRHVELQGINNEAKPLVFVGGGPVRVFNAVADDLMLLLEVVEDLPQPHLSVRACGANDRLETLWLKLDANAPAVFTVPAPLAEQVLFLAKAADVYLLVAGGINLSSEPTEPDSSPLFRGSLLQIRENFVDQSLPESLFFVVVREARIARLRG
jgi:hypothetical protein